MITWDVNAPWNGPGTTVVATPLPLPPPPSPLRLRECIRRVGVQNDTIREGSLAIDYEAKVFVGFDGVKGLDTINPKDFDC
jgi:hypothetical protein